MLSWAGRGDQHNQVVNHEAQTDIDAESAQTGHPPAELYSQIANYDLYILTGGGYMCDFDKRFLFPMFDRIEAAIAHGVPVVMVGQGIGPMEDYALLERAGQALPLIDYLMIREERVARPLLNSLNVLPHKVIMTGDDAIELAYQARTNKPGTGIGLSLRVAAYTQVNEKHLAAIRPVVLQAAKKYGAELIAAPIDVNEADINYIQEIMRGHNRGSSGWQKFESTSEIIRRISRCRVMIGGTFHGAVFALGQGIPVIALAKSVEYYNKLAGLTAEFGQEGCQVIDLKEKNLQEKLAEAIDFAWLSAEELRPQLLQQAKRQIELGHAAYQKIFDLVKTKHQI
jgi:colanic acid/amylovoran biosynthesis protein